MALIKAISGPGLWLGPEAAFFQRSRHLPIFTGRFQPTIFGTSELNFCVRNGNRWILTVIDTGHLHGPYRLCFSFLKVYTLKTEYRTAGK